LTNGIVVGTFKKATGCKVDIRAFVIVSGK
jgi:hypothetical protein